jgi:hypothetical protein
MRWMSLKRNDVRAFHGLFKCSLVHGIHGALFVRDGARNEDMQNQSENGDDLDKISRNMFF